MAVPPFDEFFTPVLRIVGESREPIHRRNLVPLVCDAMNLSQEDREERVDSGVKTKVKDRVDWSCAYLFQAKLLSRPKRGYSEITGKGREILHQNIKITKQYLREVSPEFVEFTTRRNKPRSEAVDEGVDESDDSFAGSPTERIQGALGEVKASLREDLVDRIQSLSPKAFEQLILYLMLKMGYGDIETSEHTGQSGDGGIDGIIRDNRLGLDPIYLQAKRYARDNLVGVGDINSFIGAVDRRGSNKGVFVTTSSFSKPAIEAVKETQKEIRLINGDELTKLMMRYEVGVRVEETHTIQKLDSDYFDELDEE